MHKTITPCTKYALLYKSRLWGKYIKVWPDMVNFHTRTRVEQNVNALKSAWRTLLNRFKLVWNEYATQSYGILGLNDSNVWYIEEIVCTLIDSFLVFLLINTTIIYLVFLIVVLF